MRQVIRANQEAEFSPRWGVPRAYKAVVFCLILLPKLLVAVMTCMRLRFPRCHVGFEMCATPRVTIQILLRVRRAGG